MDRCGGVSTKDPLAMSKGLSLRRRHYLRMALPRISRHCHVPPVLSSQILPLPDSTLPALPKRIAPVMEVRIQTKRGTFMMEDTRQDVHRSHNQGFRGGQEAWVLFRGRGVNILEPPMFDQVEASTRLLHSADMTYCHCRDQEISGGSAWQSSAPMAIPTVQPATTRSHDHVSVVIIIDKSPLQGQYGAFRTLLKEPFGG